MIGPKSGRANAIGEFALRLRKCGVELLFLFEMTVTNSKRIVGGCRVGV